MEEKALKIFAYMGLLAVIVYVIASALGKRAQLGKSTPACGSHQFAKGSVWARQSVPLATRQSAAGVFPTPGM